VGTVYAIERATGQIDVFGPAAPGPPAVDGVSTREVTSASAQLDAQIDPGGAKTAYVVQYSTTSCHEGPPTACAKNFSCTSGPAECGELPAPPGELAAAFGDQSVSVNMADLSPGSTYYYRFAASNEAGGTPRTAVSAEGAFSTPPATCACIADARIWEMVSPPNKGGALVEALTSEGGTIQAASDGGGFAYVSTAPIGKTEGSRSFEPTQMLATRGGGWESQDITTPNEHGIGVAADTESEYRFFSEDLSLALVQPYIGLGKMAEPPLSPPVSPTEKALSEKGKDYQENTLYVRDDRPIEPHGEAESELYDEAEANGRTMDDPGFVALVDEANALPGFGPLPSGEGNTVSLEAQLGFVAATPDLSHVVIQSTPGLYEWSGAGLQLISRLGGEHGEVVEEAALGDRNRVVRHAISNDGSRIFWTTSGTPTSPGRHLYMRDVTKTPEPETIHIDGAQGVEEPRSGGAEFQAASTDGSRVFFTDTQRLTPESGANESKPDLYVCEIAENETTHKLECKVTDLTPRRSVSGGYESADVQGTENEKFGGVLGASEDGSYVYFVANGVLSRCTNTMGEEIGCKNAEGEEVAPGHCGEEGYPQPTCNLYVEQYGSEPGNEGWPAHPTFIARLSEEDEPDWEGLDDEAAFTSRVSPNGRYLAFMSERELTHYDNVDTNPEAEGAHDEEVFLYEAGSGRLACASCNPTGARPAGVLDPPVGQGGPEGVGLLVDRPQTWAGKWLAGSAPGWTRLTHHGAEPFALYQSRYLSNSGRLFFDSPEALVPQDKNGKEDVYEYERVGVPHGRHECTSQSATYSARVEGCVGLISSGTSDRESAFLDASETGGEGPSGEELQEGGGDVFFVTTAPLSPQDTDTVFDVYDAHECTSGSPCIIPPKEKPPAACESGGACRPYSPPPYSSSEAPASAMSGPSGNLAPKHGVLPSKTAKPKPLTRAQKLAAALKTCRSKYKRFREKLAECEKQARKRYGARKARHSEKSGAPGRGGAR
jgi:hypothetical protein